MGRPKRTNKEQRETRRPSPTLPTPTQTDSGRFSLNGETWSNHGLDDMVDPTMEDVQYLVPFDFALHGTTLEASSLDVPPEHDLSPTWDQYVPSLTDEGTTVDTASTITRGRCPSRRQESTQELSNLNLELYKQLGIVGLMTKAQECLSAPGNTAGWERYSLQGCGCYDAQLADLSQAARRDTGLMSPSDHTDGDDSRGYMCKGVTAGPPPQEIYRQDSSVQLRVLHGLSHSSPPSLPIDMPTSLILLSCHTNLVYLCRDIFAAIRSALLAPRRQVTLFTFTFPSTDDVSIPPDPELQILVLAQAVIRLMEKIVHLLGYPDDGCSNDGTGHHSHALPAPLVKLFFGGEAAGSGPATGRVEMEALKGELRRLHKVVYKEV
ncbi:hypothetical protein CC79DRAFT_1400366 [Sarocladium strictum]